MWPQVHSKLTNRRKDPNYKEVSGFIPVDLLRQFRQHIAGKGLKVNEGLEEAIFTYLKQEKKERLDCEDEEWSVSYPGNGAAFLYPEKLRGRSSPFAEFLSEAM